MKRLFAAYATRPRKSEFKQSTKRVHKYDIDVFKYIDKPGTFLHILHISKMSPVCREFLKAMCFGKMTAGIKDINQLKVAVYTQYPEFLNLLPQEENSTDLLDYLEYRAKDCKDDAEAKAFVAKETVVKARKEKLSTLAEGPIQNVIVFAACPSLFKFQTDVIAMSTDTASLLGNIRQPKESKKYILDQIHNGAIICFIAGREYEFLTADGTKIPIPIYFGKKAIELNLQALLGDDYDKVKSRILIEEVLPKRTITLKDPSILTDENLAFRKSLAQKKPESLMTIIRRLADDKTTKPIASCLHQVETVLTVVEHIEKASAGSRIHLTFATDNRSGLHVAPMLLKDQVHSFQTLDLSGMTWNANPVSIPLSTELKADIGTEQKFSLATQAGHVQKRVFFQVLPAMTEQIGMGCIYISVGTSLNLLKAVGKIDVAYPARKRDIKSYDGPSVRSILKSEFKSATGEVNNAVDLSAAAERNPGVAAHLGFCESEEKYINAIKYAVDNQLPANVYYDTNVRDEKLATGTPVENRGNSKHSAPIVGYTIKTNGETIVTVKHWGYLQDISAHDLYRSTKQLPAHHPIEEYAKRKDAALKEGAWRPAKDSSDKDGSLVTMKVTTSPNKWRGFNSVLLILDSQHQAATHREKLSQFMRFFNPNNPEEGAISAVEEKPNFVPDELYDQISEALLLPAYALVVTKLNAAIAANYKFSPEQFDKLNTSIGEVKRFIPPAILLQINDALNRLNGVKNNQNRMTLSA